MGSVTLLDVDGLVGVVGPGFGVHDSCTRAQKNTARIFPMKGKSKWRFAFGTRINFRSPLKQKFALICIPDDEMELLGA